MKWPLNHATTPRLHRIELDPRPVSKDSLASPTDWLMKEMVKFTFKIKVAPPDLAKITHSSLKRPIRLYTFSSRDLQHRVRPTMAAAPPPPISPRLTSCCCSLAINKTVLMKIRSNWSTPQGKKGEISFEWRKEKTETQIRWPDREHGLQWIGQRWLTDWSFQKSLYTNFPKAYANREPLTMTF